MDIRRESVLDSVTVVTNPIAQDSLAVLRQRKSLAEYQVHWNRISAAVLTEASRSLAQVRLTIQTSMGRSQDVLVLAPLKLIVVLRAGNAMLHEARKLFPESQIGFVGARRDEVTHEVVISYTSIPVIEECDSIVICEPMIATGGTLCGVLELVKRSNQISVVSIVCAPVGIERICSKYPGVKIFTCAVDQGLDSNCYIDYPGFGDAGEKYCGF